MDRRDFIKLTAVTGTTAALTACGNPEHQLIRFVPEDEIVPGIAEWKPSVCPLCSAGCGLNVRVMDADFETTRNGQQGVVAIKAAKKLEGQPAHPVNRGGLCARGQAAIQVTYHPDRLTGPMKRTGARGSGQFAPIGWDDAIAELASKLDALTDKSALAFVVRPRRSRRLELIAELLSKLGAPAPIGFQIFGDDVLRKANGVSFGREQLPTFDLARAKFVVSFGADFLGTWNSPVAQNGTYGEMRQGRPGERGMFVQIEPRMSLSGASADEWIAIRPGTEGVLALGFAHVLVANKLGAAIDPGPLTDYAPDAVEKVTGVPAKKIERIARAMGERRPAVAIVGGQALAHTNGLFHATAINRLNAVLNSIEQPGGVFFTPQAPSLHAGPALTRPSTAMRDLKAQVLIVDDANPVFGSPAAWGVKNALAQIPFIASFGSFVDETSVQADLILPDHSFLESWTDSLPESGSLVPVANAAGPVMRPLHQTRATPDVLIELAGKLKSPIVLPWKSYDEVLKAGFDKLGAEAWDDVAKQGYWAGQPQPTGGKLATSRLAAAETWAAPQFDGDPGSFPYHFLPYPSQAFHDGSTAHLPWLQEMPDPLTSAMWSSWVEINPQTAAKLNVAHGDLVEIASTQGSLRAPAYLSPGIAPDIIAMPVGQGHDTFTRYASGRGVNPVTILAPVAEPVTGALAWAATRVKISRVGDVDGSLILFGGALRENPHEHETR